MGISKQTLRVANTNPYSKANQLKKSPMGSCPVPGTQGQVNLLSCLPFPIYFPTFPLSLSSMKPCLN